MKRKEYERPTIDVVKLQQQGILCGSGQADVQNYNWNDPVAE